MADPFVIQEGDQVIFRREDSSRVFQIRKKRQVYFEKSKFNVDELIGQPYGSTFQIDRGNLIKVEPAIPAVFSHDAVSDPGADNRNLLDTESNQKMSKDDIMKLKDDGVTGEQIIEKLIENSETFKTKTKFSQAKFLKKKKKKHIQVFTVLRPTPRLVMGIFAKEPAKICYLRQDSLSQLLNYSNIMAGSNVGVVETCQGLVLACVLQRLGGQGKLVQLIPNADNFVCRQVMDYFNFQKEELDNVFSFPLDKLAALKDDTKPLDLSMETTPGSEATAPTPALMSSATAPQNSEITAQPQTPTVESSGATEHSVPPPTQTSTPSSRESRVPSVSRHAEKRFSDGEVKESGLDLTVDAKEGKEDDAVKGSDDVEAVPGDKNDEDVEMEEDDEQADEEEEDKEVGHGDSNKEIAPKREAQRRQRAERQKIAGDLIRQKKLHSLIMACKYNPTPILMRMLDFLSPSSPVAVYCQFIEPLVECYTQIKEKHLGLQLKLSETWFREYQVLPDRTHPMMNMSGTGGYLLTFMTAQPTSDSKKS